MVKRSVEFYYDYYSPYSYFAAEKLEDLRQAFDLEIVWKPVDIVRMLRLDEGDCYNAMKRTYVNKDVAHCAEFFGLPVRMPRPFPVRSQLALITSLVVDESGFLPAFARATFQAAWARSRDIGDEDVLSECIRDTGGRPKEILDKVGAMKKEGSEKIRTLTDAAMRKNVFGVPMFVYANQMLFGSDRLPMLKAWLAQTGPVGSPVA
jgi:2-hydroxychromene-2-carboxylate isomerase